MKRQRQSAILHMIGSENIRTQEALLDGLRQRGFQATQATISRDLREMGLVKAAAPGGGHQYTRPETPAPPTARLTTVLREAVNDCVCAQNLLVVKTMPGLAPAACSAIDAMNRPDVVGTLAGDDTGLAICLDNAGAERLRDEILRWIR